MIVMKLRAFIILLPIILLTACGAADSKDTNNQSNNPSTSVVDNGDSSQDSLAQVHKPIFLNLSSGRKVDKSEHWHISYQENRGFTLNSGISGSAKVTGCTAKVYPTLYSDKDAGYGKNRLHLPVKEAFKKLTPANTLADFNKINKQACTKFKADDEKASRIKRDQWLKLTQGFIIPIFSAETAKSNGWLIRSAKADANGLYQYAKLKVGEVKFSIIPRKQELVFHTKAYDDNSQSFASSWSASKPLSFLNRYAYWDLETNKEVGKEDDWEIRIYNYGKDEHSDHGRIWSLQLNSSFSGTGDAGVGMLKKTLAEISNPMDSSQVYQYAIDNPRSTLSAPGNFGPFQYNLYGQYKMTPNFTIYLIKDGAKTYKFQVLGNYGKDGKAKSGNIYVRYSELTD